MANGHADGDNSTNNRPSGASMAVSIEFRSLGNHGPAGVVRRATGESHPFTGWLDLLSRLEAITKSEPPSLD